MNGEMRISSDATSLATSLAEALIAQLVSLTARWDTVNIAIAGGFVSSTVLAAVDANDVDWSRIRVWWVDERFVDPEDVQRNDREALSALFCRTPGVQLRPMPADRGQGIETAREEYLRQWRREMAGRSLDLTLLGMGPDGHIASLFPWHAQLTETAEVLIELDSPKPPPRRLTLSLPVLLASDRIWLAAAGESKAAPLRAAFDGADHHEFPVAALRGKKTTWWLDTAAGAGLDS